MTQFLAVHAAYHACVAWGILHPRSRLFGPNRCRLDTGEPAVAAAPCRFFRAPVGLKNPFQGKALRQAGLELVSRELRFVDRGRADPERLARRLGRRIRPGSVMLLHDGQDGDAAGNPAVPEALPGPLSALRNLGHRCAPLR